MISLGISFFHADAGPTLPVASTCIGVRSWPSPKRKEKWENTTQDSQRKEQKVEACVP